MAYTNHEVAKAQKVADLASSLVAHDLTLPKLFTHEGFEKFKGTEGDKLVYRVPGRLPHRRYAFRNDRSAPIQYDVYKEGKTEIVWGDRIYSAVQLTDEQYEFDLDGWGKLLDAQTSAVATGLNNQAGEALANAPWEVTIGGVEPAIRSAIIEARRVLNAFRVPREQRILVVGSDFEAAMLNDKDLTLTQNVEQGRAENALANAVLGRLAGFTVVLDNSIPAGDAYAIIPSSFVFTTGAPYIPNSVGFGATASVDGFSLRWLRDYDLDYVKDRSLVDTYCGVNAVKDLFLPKSAFTEDAGPVSVDVDSLKSYFVRGVKLTLDGASVYPNEKEKADLVAETGISSKSAWKAPAKPVTAEPAA